jgi:Arc/MetJ-type ribon-helix-helix transcriptional regulator
MQNLRKEIYMENLVQMELPTLLHQQMRLLVKEGWFRDETDILLEALRRFLESHRSEIMEQYIREDVEWGLDGRD